MTKLIEKNTTIPTQASKVFSTASDNQTAVSVHVLQGERGQASGNKSLGMFNLSGILPARRGEPQIEVSFDIDANGILHVTATDKKTGKDAKIQITASSGLSEDEIEGMVKDAEEHAEEDRKFAQLSSARNAAEALHHSVEKQLEEHGQQLSEAERKKIEDALAAVKTAAKKDSQDAISESISKLSEAAGPLLEKASKAGGDSGDSQDSGDEQPEVEVVSPDKDADDKKD